MDQRGMVILESKKGERTYSFMIPAGSPFGETLDAAFDFIEEVKRLANEAVEKAQKAKEAEEKAQALAKEAAAEEEASVEEVAK